MAKLVKISAEQLNNNTNSPALSCEYCPNLVFKKTADFVKCTEAELKNLTEFRKIFRVLLISLSMSKKILEYLRFLMCKFSTNIKL
ncbi:Protein of unknown function [Cotesia congregata]|uniref:Uncharacterized protein n=1 Tax=Cotesia congregata TaxID=51543 RepID=A0A8J2H9P3_COTCN|nr:Protein of unknown function [Cotesia congregata]